MSLDDYGEFSFVEVTVHFFEPGDKTYWDYFDGSGELQTFDLNLEEYGRAGMIGMGRLLGLLPFGIIEPGKTHITKNGTLNGSY